MATVDTNRYPARVPPYQTVFTGAASLCGFCFMGILHQYVRILDPSFDPDLHQKLLRSVLAKPADTGQNKPSVVEVAKLRSTI